MQFRIYILIFAGLFCTASVFGQIDYRGEKPATPVFEDDNTIPIYMAMPDSKLLSAPNENAQVISHGKYLELFFLCRELRVGNENYFLVAKLDEDQLNVTKVAGWINEKHAIRGIRAMRTQHNIYKKALIINRIAQMSLKDTKRKGNRLDVVSVYQAPSFASKKITELGLFSFFFIWKIYKNKLGEEFCLLGTRAILSDQANPNASIMGWVSKVRILEWNTRQAIQFYKQNLAQRKNQPVKIFQSIDGVNAWLQGEKSSQLPIAIEDMEIKNWKPEMTRFPLLGVKAADGFSGDINLQKVGYIGDQLSVETGRVIGQRNGIANKQQRLEALKQQVSNIDIVFAIDATGSMFKYYKYISKGIKDTISKISKKYGQSNNIDKPNVRFAIIFYRDYYDKENGISRTYKVMQLTKDLKATLKYLDDEDVEVGSGDNPNNKVEQTEAIFYSLYNGLEKLKFNKGSFRQLIVVGDFGNHLPDPRGYGVDQIVEAVCKYEINIAAIQVAPPNYMRHPHVRLFKTQFMQINEKLARLSNCPVKGDYMHKPEPDELVQYVVKNCSEAVKSSDRIKKALEKLSSGGSMQLATKNYGVKLQSKIVKMMQDVGLKPSDFKEQSAQICDIGWVAEKNPRTSLMQTETMLLVRRSELQQLATTTVNLTKTQISRKNVMKIWKKVLEEQVGQGEEVDERKPVCQYVQMHLGLPVRNNLLKISLRDISRLSPKKLADMRKTLIQDKDKLMDLLLNKRDRWFKRESVDYAWLRLDELP